MQIQEMPCICNYPMTKYEDASAIYGKDITCNLCGGIGTKDDVFWHCDHDTSATFTTNIHPSGYHICSVCMNNNRRLLQKIEFSNNGTQVIQHPFAPVESECDIQSCPYFGRFTGTMNRNGSDIHISIPILLVDYMHLLMHHDDDKDFDYIFRSLGDCDLSKCNQFTRNYRRRISDEDDVELKNDDDHDINDEVLREILVKLHCHFYHSIDIGYRLSMTDKEILHNVPINNHDDNLVNDRIVKLREIIEEKVNKCTVQGHLNTNKFNQLLLDKKSNIPSFISGYIFAYDHKDIDLDVDVWPKYKDLQQETLNNGIRSVTKNNGINK